MAASTTFIAAGGNRHPSAADWAPGLLAFGAGNNVALWNPDDKTNCGIHTLLTGHTDHVNAVEVFDLGGHRHILTGGVDETIRLWKSSQPSGQAFEQIQCLAGQDGSINTLSVCTEHGLFVSGAARGIIKVWSLSDGESQCIQSISLKPHFIPLASALAVLENGQVVLAVAGTSKTIQLYVKTPSSNPFELQATLTGHENWIWSLDFAWEGEQGSSDLMLASSSQDKFIRLWRLRKSDITPNGTTAQINGESLVSDRSLSNKSHRIGSDDARYSVSFEALLIGHEDWVYTVRWGPRASKDTQLTLLSASADNSLALWTADAASGVWICDARVGEISAQKGSTTATGSTGGFWIGLWQPQGHAIVSLGRTGSWRRWQHESTTGLWQQSVGISGHVRETQGVVWAPDGSYLLTTSSDQTTRVFGEWTRDNTTTWHELARPQIHGYDISCIDAITPNQFISGADEKLLRVFNKPRSVADLLSKLSGLHSNSQGVLSDAANIPVLGLSNKAVTVTDSDDQVADAAPTGRDDTDPASVVHKSNFDFDHPPFEDHLARHTLWPEHEKLYGHGYEISAVAASHDGRLVATACKASSIDHAVIRLYETREWRELKPPLTAHTLTIASLAFSCDDRFLLSVGRDRQWAIFEQDGKSLDTYMMHSSNLKGHSRMILDCCWAPAPRGRVFATAGRDKLVKVWTLSDDAAMLAATVTANVPITAVTFDSNIQQGDLRLLYGTETGQLVVVHIDDNSLQTKASWELRKTLCPSQAITDLQFRPRLKPRGDDETHHDTQLAVGSDDGSVRIISLSESA